MAANEMAAKVAARADEAAELLPLAIRRPGVTGREDEVSTLFADWCRARGWSVTGEVLCSSP
ncbi:hypothetical protein [Nonomuraea sp. NPDC005692]|uniref:hypothetical protein n=1 Tax=Nonomuraea sp. NPDC005692 TaxID=3157168 RepID=UPI0033DBF2D3